MEIVDRGAGAPVVLVPGIQGRWEWMKPAVEALAARCRVITFSLADEPTCGGEFDPADGLASYVRQVRDALDRAGVAQAAICGVSYGGLLAAAFAARHPDRVAALVLVSALPPGWAPNQRVRFYLRAPRLLMPVFVLSSLRTYPEIAAATPGALRAMPAGIRQGWTALTHMLSPVRTARRIGFITSAPPAAALARLHVPTLIVTGEPELDRVVPVALTRQYLAIWPHARSATIARTGHFGLVTRPLEFARIVADFVDDVFDRDGRRRIG